MPHGHAEGEPAGDRHRDLDLIEGAFTQALATASDIASLLRLAGVPFVGETDDGVRLHLLRVGLQDRIDVGSVAPVLGGGEVIYQPLPARLVSHRRELCFIYHDGTSSRSLALADARALADRSEGTSFALTP